MEKKLWIGLNGMEFYAQHGVYAEEKKIGTTFNVDVKVYADAERACLHDDLLGTINYEHIYAIVKNRMQVPVQLIEHLAYSIVEDIKNTFPDAEKINIRIEKVHPPLGGKIKSSIVEYETSC